MKDEPERPAYRLEIGLPPPHRFPVPALSPSRRWRPLWLGVCDGCGLLLALALAGAIALLALALASGMIGLGR